MPCSLFSYSVPGREPFRDNIFTIFAGNQENLCTPHWGLQGNIPSPRGSSPLTPSPSKRWLWGRVFPWMRSAEVPTQQSQKSTLFPRESCSTHSNEINFNPHDFMRRLWSHILQLYDFIFFSPARLEPQKWNRLKTLRAELRGLTYSLGR